MPDPKIEHRHGRDPPIQWRRRWCCSFTNPPLTPDHYPPLSRSDSSSSSSSSLRDKKIAHLPPYSSQCHQQQHLRPPLARRILSPGRISPIPPPLVTESTPENEMHHNSFILPAEPEIQPQEEGNSKNLKLRVIARGKNGESLVLELVPHVLAANSPIFAELIANSSGGVCRIEVTDLEDLAAFRETIELMFEDDVQKKLQKLGVSRAINILEVSERFKFSRGTASCLSYLDAVPWTEEQEEKLCESFTKLDFQDTEATRILDRICARDVTESQRSLTKSLLSSMTTACDINAKKELKSMVKSLLGKSSVYEKDYPELNKDVFEACKASKASLKNLLQSHGGDGSDSRKEKNRPLLECISKYVENINWLVDILLDHHMGERFVDLWANQEQLVKMHQGLSPMVRYELSRVTAVLFIAIGERKLHCPSETRSQLLRTWLGPMLYDFRWLHRCKKGLDMEALEEYIGQVLLTLPLSEQSSLFMEWLRCFSNNTSDCPNLSKAFQIWWRRSLQRSSETSNVESK